MNKNEIRGMIREEIKSIMTETTDYTYAKDSGGGRATMVLKLDEPAWGKVKHLFDAKGRPTNSAIKQIGVNGYVWTLYAQPVKYADGMKYKIYGVCGDYTFGNAPTFYQQKLRGNIKAAKAVLEPFISKYLK